MRHSARIAFIPAVLCMSVEATADPKLVPDPTELAVINHTDENLGTVKCSDGTYYDLLKVGAYQEADDEVSFTVKSVTIEGQEVDYPSTGPITLYDDTQISIGWTSPNNVDISKYIGGDTPEP